MFFGFWSLFAYNSYCINAFFVVCIHCVFRSFFAFIQFMLLFSLSLFIGQSLSISLYPFLSIPFPLPFSASLPLFISLSLARILSFLSMMSLHCEDLRRSVANNVAAIETKTTTNTYKKTGRKGCSSEQINIIFTNKVDLSTMS